MFRNKYAVSRISYGIMMIQFFLSILFICTPSDGWSATETTKLYTIQFYCVHCCLILHSCLISKHFAFVWINFNLDRQLRQIEVAINKGKLFL